MYDYAEAFKELSLLEDMDFDLDDDDAIKDLSKYVDDDSSEDETVDVIDLDADDADELEKSYIGKVILECPVCHSKIYKDKEDIIAEEDSEYVNVDEECPICLTEGGFEIVGEVAPYEPSNDKDEDEDKEDKSDDKVKDIEDQEDDDESDDDVDESLNESTCPDCGKDPCECEKDSEDNKELKEGFEHINVETEDSVMDMSQDENGKVTITTEPKD